MNLPDVVRFRSLLLGVALLAASSLTARAQQVSPQATRQYNAAERLHRQQQYDLAAKAWSRFLAWYGRDPRAGAATHNLGVCYYELGRLDEALEAFQKAIPHAHQFENPGNAHFLLGATQYRIAQSGRTEMYGAAAKTFETAIAAFPNGEERPEMIFLRGECLRILGRWEEALALYAWLMSDYPTHTRVAEALYGTGIAQTQLGRRQEAAATYDSFLRQYPQHRLACEVCLERGLTAIALGQNEAALTFLQIAATTPDSPLADYATANWGDTLANMGRYAEAAAVYASIPGKFPQSQYVGPSALAAGRNYYLAGNYAEARTHFQKVVQRGGDAAPEAAHWIARSLLQENQPAQALAAVEKVLPQASGNPFHTQLLVDRAEAIYSMPDRRAEAIGLYAAIAEQYADDALAPQALYMAAFAAKQEGQHEVAVKHARAFLSTYAEHELTSGAKEVAVESLLLLQKYSEGEALCEQLIREYPNHQASELWKVWWGDSLHRQKKYEEVVGALRPAIADIHTPAFLAEAWYLIGLSEWELNERESSVKSLEASLKADTSWRLAANAHLALSRAYRLSGSPEQGKAVAQRLIATFPDSPLLPDAYFEVGECQWALREFEAAAATASKLVEQWPDSPLVPDALYQRGCAEAGLCHDDQALQCFERAIQVKPELPEAYVGRGYVYLRKDDVDKAFRDFDKAIELNPDYAEAHASHGWANLKNEDYQAALDDFNRAIELKETLGDAYSGRAWIHVHRQDVDRAMDEFNKTLELDAAHDGAYRGRGFIYWAKGDLKKALADFDEAIRLFPNEAASYVLRGDLYWARYEVSANEDDLDRAIAEYTKAIQNAPSKPLAYNKRGCAYLLKGNLDKANADLETVATLAESASS